MFRRVCSQPAGGPVSFLAPKAGENKLGVQCECMCVHTSGRVSLSCVSSCVSTGFEQLLVVLVT